MKKTLWLADYAADTDNRQNWLIFASEEGKGEKVFRRFKQVYKKYYGIKFKGAIIGITELRNIDNYEICLKGRNFMKNETIEKYYFTFGFGQTDANGYSLANHYTIVIGDYKTAREKMFRAWGQKWASQYKSAENAGVEKWNLVYVPFPHLPDTD